MTYICIQKTKNYEVGELIGAVRYNHLFKKRPEIARCFVEYVEKNEGEKDFKEEVEDILHQPGDEDD